MNSPAEVLRTVASIVADRGDTHGDWQHNMDNTAAMWSAYLHVPLSGRDVAVMLALMKISRMACGAYNADDYVDLVGYAAIAAACDAEKKTA